MSRARFAGHWTVMGRVDEAVEQGRLAENSDPLASYVHAFMAYTLIAAHRFDEAASHCAKLCWPDPVRARKD